MSRDLQNINVGGPGFQQLRPASVAVLKRLSWEIHLRVGRSERAPVLVCLRRERAKATPERNLARARTNAIGSRLLSTRLSEQNGPTPARGGALLLKQFLNGGPLLFRDFCLKGEAVRVGRSERAAVLVCFRRGRAGESDPGAESGSRPEKCQQLSLALDTIEQAKPTPARLLSTRSSGRKRPRIGIWLSSLLDTRR